MRRRGTYHNVILYIVTADWPNSLRVLDVKNGHCKRCSAKIYKIKPNIKLEMT